MKNLLVFILLILLFCTIQRQILAVKKIWIQTYPFKNSKNWEKGLPPKNCSDQTIKFPSKMYSVVNIPDSITTGEIVFSEDGALVFNPNIDINLLDSSDTFEGMKKCDMKEVTFVRPQASDWYSVYSWSFEYGPGEMPFNKATPDTQYVPCDGDSVVFPNGSSFLVDVKFAPYLDFYDIEINGEKKIQNFKDFLLTEVGQSMFLNAEQTEIRAGTCEQRKNCLCQHFEGLCRDVKCSDVLCSDPVQPKGFCCSFCGAFVTFPVTTNEFDMESFMKKIYQTIVLSKFDINSVEYYATFAITDFVQLVFVDKNDYNGVSGEIADYIRTNIIYKMYGGFTISQKSGLPIVPGQTIRAFNYIFWPFFVIVIFFGAFYVYQYEDRAMPRLLAMMRTRQFTPSQFIFARFDNQNPTEGTIDIDLKIEQSEEIGEKPSSFHNPMYEEGLNLKESGLGSSKSNDDVQEEVETEVKDGPKNIDHQNFEEINLLDEDHEE